MYVCIYMYINKYYMYIYISTLCFSLVSEKRLRPRIHGGYDGVDLYQDTWRFDSQAAGQAAGLHGLHAWSRISSVSTAMPSARAKHVGAWDPAGAFWIHGGYNGSPLATSNVDGL